MSVLLFIVILVALVIGHEAGHFVAAKLSGMRVPEFGVGFPPRLWGKKIGDTEYTINAIPLGGFVKIHGEDGAEADPGAFSSKPRYAQAATLLAGPFMNLVIAFVLSSVAFMVGIPAAVDSGYGAEHVEGVRVLVTDILPGSPADKAGLKVGDTVTAITEGGTQHAINNPDQISALVQEAEGPVSVSLIRAEKPFSITVSPEKGIITGTPEQQAIGVATNLVGTLRLSFFESIGVGFNETLRNMVGVVQGIGSLIGRAFSLSANLSEVAGPVGIASLTGSAASLGLGAILSFAALISINLGVINLFPFPALDGGRLALLLIEAVSGRRVPAKVSSAINNIGFALLILLMVVITAHDISRLIS